MILILLCIAGTCLSYYLGIRARTRRYGTPGGWLTVILIGVLLGLAYYAFSAFGLLVSLDSLVDSL